MGTQRGDEPQAAGAVLMVRPVRFAANPDTAASNAFQRPPASGHDLQATALQEFEGLVLALRAAGVEVCVFDDTLEPHKPDAVFPNNWVSFHHDGSVVLYPMQAVNRRAERRTQLIEELQRRHGFRVTRWLDLSGHEREGRYLESTGSMVLDRVHHVAYACLSSRTDAWLLGEFGRQMDYRVLPFHGSDEHGRPLYHTNVMLCIGRRFAVLCAEAIENTRERRQVVTALESSGHPVIAITRAQVRCFAGNLLELRGAGETPVIALSRRARASLTPDQAARLAACGRLVDAPVDTIEDAAGGSVRCMLAAIHLPRG